MKKKRTKANFYGMPWLVMAVKTLPDYMLELDFIDGSKKHYDMKPQLYGIFEELKNPELFSKAFVMCGCVAWNDRLDIAPEELYENRVIVNG